MGNLRKFKTGKKGGQKADTMRDAKEGQRDLSKKNQHLYIEMRTVPYNAERAYRESSKSARNLFASFSCQSEVGARRPKKKHRLAGSSTAESFE